MSMAVDHFMHPNMRHMRVCAASQYSNVYLMGDSPRCRVTSKRFMEEYWVQYFSEEPVDLVLPNQSPRQRTLFEFQQPKPKREPTVDEILRRMARVRRRLGHAS